LSNNNLFVAFVASEALLTLAVHYKVNTTPTDMTKIVKKCVIYWFYQIFFFLF